MFLFVSLLFKSNQIKSNPLFRHVTPRSTKVKTCTCIVFALVFFDAVGVSPSQALCNIISTHRRQGNGIGRTELLRCSAAGAH